MSPTVEVVNEQVWKMQRLAFALELAKVMVGRVNLGDADSMEKLPTLAVKTADRLMVTNYNMAIPTFQVQDEAANSGDKL